MAVIVKADVETVSQFSSGSVFTLNGKQKIPAYFRLLVDDFTLDDAIEAYRGDNNIVALDYVGNLDILHEYNRARLQGIYMVREFEFGDNITEEDIVDMINRVPAEVTVLVKLSETYKDMRFVQTMCKKYRNLRFSGGILFALEGCRLGCCSKDILTERGVRLKSEDFIKTGNGCALEYINATSADLFLKEKIVKTKTTKVKLATAGVRNSTDKSLKAPKEVKEKEPKKPTTKQAMGSLLFSGGISAL